MLPLAGLIGGAASLIGGLFGIGQRRKANRLARNTVFPTASVAAPLVENVGIAQQMASTGLPDEQYNLATQNINRNQAGALRTLSTLGRPSSAAGILRQTNDATLRLDAADAAARQANQRTLMQQNQVLAQEQNRVWDWNNRQKYLMQLQEISQLRNAGNQNIFGSLGSLVNLGIGGAFGGGSAGNNGSWLQNIFGGGGSTNTLPNIQGGAGFAGITSAPSLNTGPASISFLTQ